MAEYKRTRKMGRRRYTSSMTRVRVDKKMRKGIGDADVLVVAGACCCKRVRESILQE